MRRLLLNAATALALLLGLAASALWIRSHFVGDTVTRYTFDRPALRCDQYLLESESGLVHVTHTTWTFDTPEALQLLLDGHPDIPGWTHRDIVSNTYVSGGRNTFERLGFYHERVRDRRRAVRVRPRVAFVGMFNVDSRQIAFPHWPLALVLILPLSRAATLIRRHIRAKRNPATCPHCGYDLRATPTRCPECGATPAVIRPPAVPPNNPTTLPQYTPPCDSPPPSS